MLTPSIIHTVTSYRTPSRAPPPSTRSLHATPGDPLHDHLACFEVPEGALRQARALVPVQARARLGYALIEAHVRELRDHLRLVRVGVSVGTVSNRIVRVWKSIGKRVEIEAMGMRRTSLNIALRFSSSRKDAICGSMPCWGAMSNRNPRVTRSD